jgi:hypothetical protein
MNKYENGVTVRELHVLQTSLLNTGNRSPARCNPGEIPVPLGEETECSPQINLDTTVTKNEIK